jgi:hypothetical protein
LLKKTKGAVARERNLTKSSGFPGLGVPTIIHEVEDVWEGVKENIRDLLGQ